MATQKPEVAKVQLPAKASEIASIRVVDTDLVVILKNGQRLNIRDGAMRAMLEPELRIAFSDGELRASDMLKQAGDVYLGTLSGATVSETPGNVPAPEKVEEPHANGREMNGKWVMLLGHLHPYHHLLLSSRASGGFTV